MVHYKEKHHRILHGHHVAHELKAMYAEVRRILPLPVTSSNTNFVSSEQGKGEE